jgi:site-specific recombinase XerD
LFINEKYLYIKEFLMGYSRRVKKDERCWLMKLMHYLEDKNIPVEIVGEKEAGEYKTWLKEQKHLSPVSMTACIRTAVRFYYYLKEQDIIHKNPFTRCDKEVSIKPEVLKEYEEEARQRGLRKRTIACYSKSIKIYLDYLAFNGLTVEEIKASSAMAYLKFLVDEKKFTKGVIACNHEAIKSFYNFLYRKMIVLSNPFKGIKRMKTNKKIPRNLPKEKEMDKILEATKDFSTGTKYRKIRRYKFHVIAELMYATGMRIDEVSKLKEEDINFEKGIILVRDGKGGKSRIALLNDYAKEILRIYVKMRSLLHDNNYKRGDSLFGLSSCHLEIMVNEELKRYGNYTSHFFRHSVGYHLLKAGCDIRYIQEILGHESIKQTEIYTKVDKEDLLNIIDKYHPRQWHENK